MRVAYVTMQFPATTETFAGSDVRVLRASGVEVAVFALRPPHPEHDTMLRERGLTDVPTSSTSPGGYLRGLMLMVTHPRWSAALVRWIVRHHYRHPIALVRCVVLAPSAMRIFVSIAVGRFDVVHLFWGHYPALVGTLVQQFLPEVVSSMFLGAYDLAGGRYGSWIPGSAPVARGADLVWTHSRSNLPRLRSLGVSEERLRCVYRGVDLTRFAPANDAAPRDPSRVVAIGSLIERKGIDDVLRVFARVLGTVPGATLHILGAGPERSTLENLARSLDVAHGVTFRGHESAKEIAAELQRASAFVLMSREDRLPNVVKEAMASGCPVVVTGTQGMEELVIHGHTGFCVAIGDVDGAARHLEAILLDPDGHRALIDHARAHVAERFSVQVSMDAYRAAWRDAVDTKQRGGLRGRCAPAYDPGGPSDARRSEGED